MPLEVSRGGAMVAGSGIMQEARQTVAHTSKPPFEIKGLQKASLVDYPGKVCSTVFTGGCNFRCPFCHNPDLVLRPQSIPAIPVQELRAFLESRKKWIDAVCISGGEPTMHEWLPEFSEWIKEMGFLVKVDTNGSFPETLQKLIDSGKVDYIAMDIKSDKENYGRAAGVAVDLGAVQRSISLLMDSGVDYEFRTTAVPGFFSQQIAENIAIWLEGAKHYSLQQFRPKAELVDPKFRDAKPFSSAQLAGFAKLMQKRIKRVEIKE